MTKKAIILAAGCGNRLGHYTQNRPKCLLEFNGNSILQHQLRVLNSIGITDIIVVTGYYHHLINFDGIRCIYNRDYAETNMVESLMCARDEFVDDILVAYGDILFSEELAEVTATSKHDIAVAVDCEWRPYWQLRFGTTEEDLESLTVAESGQITELGHQVTTSDGIDYRYIGLIKFSAAATQNVKHVYDSKRIEGSSWSQSLKSFKNGYFTDLLNEMIEHDYEVRPVITKNGWFEFDTVEDYNLACKLMKDGRFSELIPGFAGNL
ncbi:hypothetical protein BVX99_02110 [bacterium F16]|nr:hypothetical protein BVX99_02045 [bacterium F16]OVE77662.1 hypothetical protein BVX99_02110 [bacterium F16]